MTRATSAYAFVLAAVITGCTVASAPTDGTPSTPAPRVTAISSASPSPSVSAAFPGAIAGRLEYPSEAIPPLRIYAVDTSSSARYRVVHTATNQTTYTLAGIPPGTYHVYAHAYTFAPNAIGGYTRAIACRCPDHTLVPVRVDAGQIARGIDVIDWSAQGELPRPPTGGEPFAAADAVTVANPFADEVNLRTEPSLGARLIGTIPNGEIANVADGPKSTDGYDWYFVRSGTLSGWAVGYAFRR